ncbi:unnamed protein product [Callosobruchus maculatus]|uniref:THAP-type domain-containing protein n=1 Tax=Callosobruchus maculatus TaxID=64391 RepID=A0A653CXK9_CALMS|nr:unnamed protein product [Callosobruchus maculatus]
MVNSCSAFNCTARYIKGGNLKFHCFPKDAALREKWIRAVRRKDFEPGSRAVLCSKHFEDSDYVQTVMDTKRLKKDAVPSIFDFPAPFNIKRKQRKMSKECHSPIEDSTPQPSTLCGNPPILTEQAKVDEAVPVRINKRRYGSIFH